jgi:hypothetical protein
MFFTSGLLVERSSFAFINDSLKSLTFACEVVILRMMVWNAPMELLNP